MPFAKGNSGNPGGRPKIVKAVEEVAREHTPLAMRTLAEICADKKAHAGARVSAASTLLDRGWGKARQEVKVSGTVDVTGLDNSQLDSLARAELAAFLGAAIARNPEETSTGIVH